MVAERLWRAARLVGMTLALAGVSVAQPASDDIAQLKAQLAQMQKQIELLTRKLEKMEAAEATAAPAAQESKSYPARSLTASTTPIAAPLPSAAPPLGPLPVANPPLPRAAAPQPVAGTSSPLQILIGDVAITPVGFMDLTADWKDKNAGGSLGSNFGNVPYNNVFPQAKDPEFKFSPQNSRLGFRVDGVFKGVKFLAYNEFDFLGTSGSNSITVTNGAFVPRIRLYWVDLRKDKFEFLAGQSWSMMTPNRKGISALPGDIFYSQVMDVNYVIGLTWTRQPGMRFIYHPSDKVAIGFSAENPDAYIGGSGGGPGPTLPSAFSGIAGVQLDNGSNVQTTPNLHPDFIAKLAFDPSSRAHVELVGLERTFRIYDNVGPNVGQYSTKAAGGGALNVNLAVAKNFRVISNNFWSDGGGRYMFGEVPDLIVRADGSISPIHSGGFNEGFEATAGKFLFYGYYGSAYARRDTALDANGTTLIGYGYRGAPNSQNKTIQEITFGYNQTVWKDAKYGAINIITQYEYLMRNPWYIAPNSPKATHDNTIYVDVRYTLPGSAPTMLPPTAK